MRSKRILSLVLALVMVLGTFGTVFAVETTVEQDAAAFLKEAKVLVGDDEGALNLEKNLERRDMVVLLSRLMGEEEVASEFPTSEDSPTWEDVRSDAYYLPMLAWGQVNKYFAGKSETVFAPREAITAQDYAVVLLRALGYDMDGHDAWTSALQTATDLGILADVTAENATKITRGQMSVMTLNTLGVKVKDSTKTLAETLEIVLPVVVPTELEVVSVSANNLKEIEIVFNKAVDKVTAETLQAYSVVRSSVVHPISNVTLSEDGMVATLVLEDTHELVNQNEYMLSFSGVKSSDLTQTVEVTDYKFKALDTVLPSVEKIESLGNKTIKVTFNEPVKFDAGATVSTTFKLNNTSLFANHDIDGRTIILTMFQELAEGTHKLSVNNKIVDYAGYKLIVQDVEFSVVKDDVAPSVSEVKDVTFEGFTVVFSEDVQPTSVDKANFSYKEGSATIKATNVERLDSKTYRVKIALPGYRANVSITGVKDYSGNTIDKDTKVEVLAQLDQTRPEVLGFRYNATAKRFEVTFSKDVQLSTFKSANVIVKDSDAKVISNSYVGTFAANSNRILYITPSLNIKAGTHTVELSGIKDNTKLENAMEPFTATFTIKDGTAPNATSLVEGAQNQFIINFDKAMELAGQYSILNPANYYVQYTTTGGTTLVGALPEGTSLTPLNDKKGVIVVFDSSIVSVQSITIQGVKDSTGNFLAGYAKTFPVSGTATVLNYTRAIAEGTKKVKVKFNAEIGAVNKNLITVNGLAIKDAAVTADKTVVELTLNTALSNPVLGSETIKWSAGAFTSLLGNQILVETTGKAITDNIAPSIVKNSDGDVEYVVSASNTGEGFVAIPAARQLFINLTEDVKVKNAPDASVANALLASNLKVTKADGTELAYITDYTFTGGNDFFTGANTIEITLVASRGYVGPVFVEFTNANGNVIQKTNGNSLATGATLEIKLATFTNVDSDAQTILFDTKAPVVSSVGYTLATAATYVTADKITIIFSENIDASAITISDITSTGTLGAATLTPITGNVNELVITLAADTTLVSTNTITIDATKVIDTNGNAMVANFVITLP